jgi:PAS domain S-box-containing protein
LWICCSLAEKVEKHTKDSLLESEARFQALLNNSLDVIYRLNLQKGKYEYMSPSSKTLLGFEPQEMMAMSNAEVLSRVHPDDLPALKEELARVNVTGKGGCEYRFLGKDGKYNWWSNQMVLSKDKAGKPLYRDGYVRVVTERKKAEKKLKDSNQKINDILSSIQDDFYVLDGNWIFVYTNKHFTSKLSKEPKDFIGKNIWTMFPKHLGTIFEENLRAAMEKREIRRFEIGGKYTAGWYRMTVFPSAEGITVLGTDITERKKAEEALRESEQRLRFHAENTPLAVVEWDSNFVVTRWAGDAQKMFGYAAAETIGKPIMDLQLVYEPDIPIVQKTMNRLTTGEIKVVSSNRNITKDGQIIYCTWYNSVLLDEKGKMVSVFSFIQNNTERVKAEKALEKSNLNLEKLVEERTKKLELSSLYARSLIEASLDPLVTINAEGKITDINKATEQITGYTKEQLVGSDFSDYFTEPEKAREGYKQVFTEGFVRDYPLAIKSKSGKITFVLYNASVYTNQAGEIQGVFAAARDITQLRKAEEAAQEAADKLKNSERLAAIGQTAGMVGHDIRNPLQAISGDVYLAKSELAEAPATEQIKCAMDSLDEIQKNVEYINKIVADLQDFAKPLKPQAEEADLKRIIDSLLIKTNVPENVKLSVKVESEAVKVVTDSTYVNRIMYNLVNNAIQALPKGGKLEINAYKKANNVIISVTDTGVGIPENIKSKMFTPMFTTKSKGQGFGLPVVKRMTEALGGSVSFESVEGKGTTFIVRLPFKKDAEDEPKKKDGK